VKKKGNKKGHSTKAADETKEGGATKAADGTNKDGATKATDGTKEGGTTKYAEENFRKGQWTYQRIICMLNYFCGTRLNALFAAHQYSRLCSGPLVSHEKAIKCTIRCPMRLVCWCRFCSYVELFRL
jgi:hypothetical protein